MARSAAVRSVAAGSVMARSVALRWVAMALAALIVLAGCGAQASPSPSPRATGLPAGTYTSTAFQPPVTFTIPAGWLIVDDRPSYFALQPAISYLVGVFIFRSPRAAAQDPTCPSMPAPAVGTSSAALSAWIAGLKSLTVSAPHLVSVGGLSGVELDVRIADGWTASCPYAQGLPAVPLFVGPDDFRWTVAGTERLRLDLLDAPDGSTVAVAIAAFDGALFPDLLTSAQPIVRSLAFKAG